MNKNIFVQKFKHGGEQKCISVHLFKKATRRINKLEYLYFCTFIRKCKCEEENLGGSLKLSPKLRFQVFEYLYFCTKILLWMIKMHQMMYIFGVSEEI